MAVFGFQWDVPPSVLAGKTAEYAGRLRKAIVALGTYFAGRLEAYAKANAPWTDRTGHARQSLTGRCVVTAGAVTIVLASLMEYGIWLEIAHGGQYQIILPTIQAHLAEIGRAMNDLMGA